MSIESFHRKAKETVAIGAVLDAQFLAALAAPDHIPGVRQMVVLAAPETPYERVWASWPQFPATVDECEVGKRYRYEERGVKLDDRLLECAFCKVLNFERDGVMMILCHGSPDIQESYVCYPKCYEPFVARLRAENKRGPIEIQCPAEFIGANFEALSKDQKQLKKLMVWPWKLPFVRILAPTGRGKTYACWAAALAVARKGGRVQFDSALDLRSRWYVPLSREKVEQGAMRTKWLILDEFGSADFRFGWAEFLLKLVSYRLDNKLPTILAGKDTPASILENMRLAGSTSGESFVSRLQSFEPCNPVGPDRREKK